VILKLSGTHQFLAYTDDVSLLRGNIGIIKKQTLIDANIDVGLEINPEKTKCILLALHQNASQIWDINIGNRLFENVSQSNIWEQQQQIKV
jgi:hypothetical protein